MTLTHTALCPISVLTGTVATYYTVPTSTKTYVKSIILYNVDTVIETVVLYNSLAAVNAANDSGASMNRFLSIDLQSNETVILNFSEPIVMAAGDTIRGYAGTTQKVSIQIMGATEPT